MRLTTVGSPPEGQWPAAIARELPIRGGGRKGLPARARGAVGTPDAVPLLGGLENPQR